MKHILKVSLLLHAVLIISIINLFLGKGELSDDKSAQEASQLQVNKQKQPSQKPSLNRESPVSRASLAAVDLPAASSLLNFRMVLEGADLIPKQALLRFTNTLGLTVAETSSAIQQCNAINEMTTQFLGKHTLNVLPEKNVSNMVAFADLTAAGPALNELKNNIARQIPEKRVLKEFILGFTGPLEKLLARGIRYELIDGENQTIDITVSVGGNYYFHFYRDFTVLNSKPTSSNQSASVEDFFNRSR